MEAAFRVQTRKGQSTADMPLMNGTGRGLVGGLAGTLVRDLVLMGLLVAVGLPALTCFTVVGETLASLFSIQGIGAAEIALLGAAGQGSGRSPPWGVIFR